jgi:iron complex transport system permease protein
MVVDKNLKNSNFIKDCASSFHIRGVARLNRSYAISVFTLLLVGCVGLQFGATSAEWDLIRALRLARVLLAAGIGMGLAVAGAVLQVLFNNPLCEPYILGISSGSALGLVVGLSLGVNWSFGGLMGTSFFGALIFAGVLYWVAYRRALFGEAQGQSGFLLVGVTLGFMGNGLLALWVAMTDPNQLQSPLVWFFGDLSRARLVGAVLSLGVVGVVFSLILAQAKSLDAFLLGEDEAISIGVDVPRLQRLMIGLTSVLVGVCVSGGGVIGFIGLLVPHGVRRWVGAGHRHLLPHCALWGATALVFADFISRWVFRPYELPVGVVTALAGSPVLIWILLQRGRELK